MTARFRSNPEPLADARGSESSRDREGAVFRNGTAPRGDRTGGAQPEGREAAERLLYAVTHELRGPLVNVRGFLARLRKGCAALQEAAAGWPLDPAERRRWEQTLEERVLRSVEIAERSAATLDRRLAALLELSRAGREPLRIASVEAGELARAVAAEYRAEAVLRGAAIEAGAVPGVQADAARLTAILRELVSNAVKFLDPARPGRIAIGGRRAGAEVWLEVRDNGIGVRAGDGERIFEPFGRVRQIEAPGEGTGLARVRKLVEQQGGRVWVESEGEAGSTFYVALPPAG